MNVVDYPQLDGILASSSAASLEEIEISLSAWASIPRRTYCGWCAGARACTRSTDDRHFWEENGRYSHADEARESPMVAAAQNSRTAAMQLVPDPGHQTTWCQRRGRPTTRLALGLLGAA